MNRQIYTQGLSVDTFEHTGDFTPVKRGQQPLEWVLSVVRLLPVPHECDDTTKICPPAIGFSDEHPINGNVARIEDGSYVLMPGGFDNVSKTVSLDEVEHWVMSKYYKSRKEPGTES